MSIVRVMVCGRATNDPTIREVNGSSCASFGIAGDTGTKDEHGNYETAFFSVSVWGKKGETIARHLKKGERVLVTGAFSQRMYKDQGGESRVQNKIRAQDVEFLGGGQAKPTETSETSDDFPL